MTPVWVESAREYVGLREIPGPKSNETILGWAKKQGNWIASYFVNDEIPWCALFVNGVFDEVHIKGTGSLAAKSFATWGRGLHTPALGAVLVFNGGPSRPGGGHVGFYLGERESDGAYLVLGGNQRNAVTDDTWIAQDRLIATRWPYRYENGTEIALPRNPRRIMLTGEGKLSSGEA